jgi:SNF2 family DNA or RNA helicase
MKALNRQLSDPEVARQEGATELEGPPLTSIKHITRSEVADYRERTKWINNPAYQPQNHIEACKILGIANPDQPRMEGLLGNLKFDFHQPTGINAMVTFEDSCVGGGLLAEEVGLGKTVMVIGLLLFRSNQRREAIIRGDEVPKALPTIIIMPQSLIPQWRDEILKFTDRFTIVIYYGAGKQSGDPKVVYLGSAKKTRLTRNHPYFNGDEANSDVIILTSYTTLMVRHGPKVQKEWLIQEHCNKVKGTTRKEAELWLRDNGFAYESLCKHCPHQLHGLFAREILDEGHEIRHQSPEIGFTVNNLGATYRHIISGTPTFNSLEEFCGLMHFLQNPELEKKEYLQRLGFEEDDIIDFVSADGEELEPLDAALYDFDPYTVPDDDPRAPLKYCQQAMTIHIFNKILGYSLAEQGARMAQIFRKIMVRRTHSSKLDGRSIGETLPSVQRMVFECDFTEQERRHYDAANADTSTALFKKGKNANSVEWNTTTYRKLCLLSTWLGFQYLLDYKATKLAAKRKNMDALSILKDLRAGQKRKGIPTNQQIPVNKNIDGKDVQTILHWHCVGSPKLRKLLGILAEIIVLRQEKALLWVNNPAQSEWLEHVSLSQSITLICRRLIRGYRFSASAVSTPDSFAQIFVRKSKTVSYRTSILNPKRQ